MKPVDVSCARISIQENDDYSLVLTRDIDNSVEVIHLYGVTVTTPFKTYRLFVLAESPDGAISQASCAKELSDYKHFSAQDARSDIVYTAEPLELMLRGWSGTKF